MMKLGKCCSKGSCIDCALLVLRLALGIIFVIHGYGKLFGNAPGMEAFTGMVAGLGFPAPALFAYIAALTEFLGGIAMILGIFTKPASVLLAIVMLVAWGGVKKFNLPKGDADFALLAMAVAIYLAGPGCYTIRRWMKGGSKEGMMKSEACEHCSCDGPEEKK